MSDNQAIPLIKNKKKSSVGKTRLKTTTPSLEAGGSPRSTPSPLTSPPSPTAVALEEDDDFTFPDDEGQRLLDESRVAGKLKDSSDRIRVLGVPLPKPLLYLLSAPAILFVLILIRPHSFFPSSTRITFSNGTDLFHPTTILISLDGFRPSYLTSHSSLLPNLLSLAESPIGLRAEYMLPIFPTITFPNHWAMMTGLYPAWSGIVANDFFAPDMSNEEFSRPAPVNDGQGGEKSGREFVYADPDKSWDSGWWWGEPMWGVVEKAGCKAANLMWPGPPVTSTGITPTYFVPFRDMSPSDKVEQIFHWLDHPLSQRPVFITAYFPEVDAAGHTAGPESEEVEGALRSMDNMVGGLMEGLEKRNLTGIVNVIIVSDHGMASTSNDRLIFLDDILGPEGLKDISHRDGWPNVGLRFNQSSNTTNHLQTLLNAAEKSNGSFAVYTKETMPSRWNFKGTDRIAPIYLIPALGWAVTDHHEFEVVYKGDYRPKGNHGYDNTYEEMRAIFVVQGPFVTSVKDRNLNKTFISTSPLVIDPFSNLELYSLVLRLLDLQNKIPPHNGTLHYWDHFLS